MQSKSKTLTSETLTAEFVVLAIFALLVAVGSHMLLPL
jgi:hypothetical protein